MKPIYFLSDAHLGAQDEAQEALKRERLFSFLDYVKTEKADLVIVGDLFDFWFEYKSVIPRLHFRVLCKLADLTRFCTIHYIAGNHDFWLDSFMRHEIGLSLHPDEFIIQWGEYNIFIIHGDGLMKRDSGYRLMKRVFRNKCCIKLYRMFHPDLGISLALGLSRLSRKSGDPEEKFSDQDYRDYARTKLTQGYNIVIMGHTHIAANEKTNGGWYVNPGNWMQDFSFAVVDENGPALYQWNGNSAAPFKNNQQEV
ncbi:MAG: UDP-2,3-diacylglucosamine diphosphatase [candidate division KSB1 bacterium]|nr:UDP-2,3-diacylglucosamine diphosphatase [candidate division KSB1 bacterium]